MATHALTAPLVTQPSTIETQPSARSSRGRSILRRILDGMIESQRQRAEREVRRFFDLVGQPPLPERDATSARRETAA